MLRNNLYLYPNRTISILLTTPLAIASSALWAILMAILCAILLAILI